MDNNKKIAINSIILGLFLSSSMVTKLITSVISFNNNIVIFVGGLLVASFLLNLRRTYSLKLVAVNMVVIVAFMFSYFANAANSSFTMNYLLNYFLYGAAGMILCSIETDGTTVMKAITAVFGLFSVLTVIKYIPQAQNVLYIEQSMDISYTMVIGLSASVFVLKNSNIIFRILICGIDAISLYYLLFLSDCRGAVLSLVFLGMIVLLRRSKHKIFISIVFIALMVFVLWGWDSIIEALSESHSEMRWISRFRRGTDIFSGRSDLFEIAKDVISNNALGKGIGYFETVSEGQYTHNIYTQLLCEFGIFIGGALSIYITVLTIKSLIDKRSTDFDIFCICQFVPRLLLSSVYWSNPFIWVFVYYKSGMNKDNGIKKPERIR